MKYAILRCCVTQDYLKQYDSSTDAVLSSFGVEFVDIKEFNCCGYPLKNIDTNSCVLASARNLALAEKEDLEILTFCNCCFETTKHVIHLMNENPTLKEEANSVLEKEGLKYEGKIGVKHLLEVFYHDIGPKKIQEKLGKTYKDLKIATHYGCHLLRPREIVQFDNPLEPTYFDQLIEATGAKSIPWNLKLECCGSPVWGVDDDLSTDITQKKIDSAKDAGADYLCVACPFCQLQFDRAQKMLSTQNKNGNRLPSVLFTQLLGMCLEIDIVTLGIDQNEINAMGLGDFIS